MSMSFELGSRLLAEIPWKLQGVLGRALKEDPRVQGVQALPFKGIQGTDYIVNSNLGPNLVAAQKTASTQGSRILVPRPNTRGACQRSCFAGSLCACGPVGPYLGSAPESLEPYYHTILECCFDIWIYTLQYYTRLYNLPYFDSTVIYPRILY